MDDKKYQELVIEYVGTEQPWRGCDQKILGCDVIIAKCRDTLEDPLIDLNETLIGQVHELLTDDDYEKEDILEYLEEQFKAYREKYLSE